jgi:predicted site-specific integrase-resolvase
MKLRYTIPEFCQLTGLSRSKAYERIRLGQITVIKDGHQTFIAHDEATRYATTPQPVAYPRESSQVA